jgi:hypothetical protein
MFPSKGAAAQKGRATGEQRLAGGLPCLKRND